MYTQIGVYDPKQIMGTYGLIGGRWRVWVGLGCLVLVSLIPYLKGMRTIMFQLYGFYHKGV